MLMKERRKKMDKNERHECFTGADLDKGIIDFQNWKKFWRQLTLNPSRQKNKTPKCNIKCSNTCNRVRIEVFIHLAMQVYTQQILWSICFLVIL